MPHDLAPLGRGHSAGEQVQRASVTAFDRHNREIKNAGDGVGTQPGGVTQVINRTTTRWPCAMRSTSACRSLSSARRLSFTVSLQPCRHGG